MNLFILFNFSWVTHQHYTQHNSTMLSTAPAQYLGEFPSHDAQRVVPHHDNNIDEILVLLVLFLN